jgi:hypothetical protein
MFRVLANRNDDNSIMRALRGGYAILQNASVDKLRNEEHYPLAERVILAAVADLTILTTSCLAKVAVMPF